MALQRRKEQSGGDENRCDLQVLKAKQPLWQRRQRKGELRIAKIELIHFVLAGIFLSTRELVIQLGNLSECSLFFFIYFSYSKIESEKSIVTNIFYLFSIFSFSSALHPRQYSIFLYLRRHILCWIFSSCLFIIWSMVISSFSVH